MRYTAPRMLIPALVIVCLAGRAVGEERPGGRSASPIDEVETRDGRVYRGRVVGYDVGERSYVLEVSPGERVKIRESDVLTVRSGGKARVEATPDAPPPLPDVSLPPATGSTPSPPRLRDARPASPADEVPLSLLRASEDEPGFLSRLLSDLDDRHAPRDATARQSFHEGVRRVRLRRLADAVPFFERALGEEPDCGACELFLAAIHLERQDHSSAYRVLEALRRRRDDAPIALEMLARASRELGLLGLESRFTEEWIRRRFSGAEQAWRIFRFRRERDPHRAVEAWRAYVQLDPDLSLVDTAEGRLFRRGREALQRGEHEQALAEFAAAVRENGHMRSLLTPHRITALEQMIAARRGRVPVNEREILVLVEALRAENEAPAAAPLDGVADGVERALIERRLDRARTPREVEAALREIEPWVPDAASRHPGVVTARLRELARSAIDADLPDAFGEILDALSARSPGAELDDSLRDLLAARVERTPEGPTRSAWIDAVRSADPALADRLAARLAVGTPVNGRLPPGSVSSGDANPGTTPKLRRTRPPARGGTRSRLPEPGSTQVVVELPWPERPRAVRSRIGQPPSSTAPDTTPGAGSSTALPRPSASGIERIHPLAAGSWWRYRHGDGTRDTVRVVAVDMDAVRGRVHRLETEIDFEESSFVSQKSAFLDDSRLAVGQSSDPALAEPLLVAPVELGRKWTWRRGSRNDIVCEREYVDVDAEVSCPAGTFSGCVRVRSTCRYERPGLKSAPIVREFVYAPGVGLVKVEGENPLDGRELEAYEIGDARTRSGESSRGSSSRRGSSR